MPDTDRLINKDQGDSIIAAIQGITSRLQEMYTVDDALSSTSENPVQNKVVKGALDGKVDKVEGKGLSSNDFTDEDKEALDNMELDIASTQTATGNPITLTDAAPINAESLVVVLEPKQEGSGDPSPTNIRPITGYDECEVVECGKNLLDPSNIFETGKYINSSGGFSDSQNYNTYKFELEPNQYVISKYDNSTAIFQIVFSLACFDANDTLISNTLHYSEHQSSADRKNIAFEYPQNAAYVLISLRVSSYDIQLEQGTTATTYEPYHSSNATIQFGQTVYGAIINFRTGECKVNMGFADLGDLNWNYNSSYGFLSTTLSSVIKNAPSYSVKANIFCSNYETGTYNEITGALSDYKIGVSGGNYGYVVTRDTRYSDAATFKNAMSGVQLVYELAEPYTIQLTPQELQLLKGTNNLSTNGTTINLGYQPDNVIGDVKGEIEKCAVDAEFMQFTDGTDTFTDVNLSLDALSHTVSVVGSKIEQKRFICFEVMDKMGGVLQGILASCIAFADGAKTPSGTAFHAYIDSLNMYVHIYICGSAGSYMLSYQSETSFSASAFYVRVRMMNNL